MTENEKPTETTVAVDEAAPPEKPKLRSKQALDHVQAAHDALVDALEELYTAEQILTGMDAGALNFPFPDYMEPFFHEALRETSRALNSITRANDKANRLGLMILPALVRGEEIEIEAKKERESRLGTEEKAKLDAAFKEAEEKAEKHKKTFEVYRHDGDYGHPDGDVKGTREITVCTIEVGEKLPRGWVFLGLAKPEE